MFIHNPYIKIARIDHWFKNIFMLPGIVFALDVTDRPLNYALLLQCVLGVFVTCILSSANYTINEWLDAKYDKLHPTKKNRPSACGLIKAPFVYMQYTLLVSLGLGMAYTINPVFFWLAVIFIVMGVAYNVEPIRIKDKVFLDVLAESVNNPLRFLLGWTLIVHETLPPSSILWSYWMAGTFLMAVKRFAEYRMISTVMDASLYRRSFQYYDEITLLLFSLFAAMTSMLFLGIFLIKYRVGFVLSFPFISFLFIWYLKLAFKENSPVQTPEKLFREKHFSLYVVLVGCLILILLKIDMPWLQIFIDPLKF